jgi:hypothetical protein
MYLIQRRDESNLILPAVYSLADVPKASLSRRDLVVREMLETERSYVESIQIMCDVSRIPALR